MKKYLSLALIVGLFTACSEPKEYKNEVCIIGGEIFNGVEPECKEGQVFSFQPNTWGNEQMPITIVTYFCDFSFPIVQNNAGVSCIYKRRFNAPKPSQTQEKQQEASQESK